MKDEKLNILIIPDLFPRQKNDLQGIFILDYLRSTKNYCYNVVLSIKLIGPKKGFSTEQIDDIPVHRYFFSSSSIPAILKPILYIALFIKGRSIATKLSKPHIIHAHGTIISGTLAFLIAKKLNVPFVITEHQGPFSVISDSFIKRKWAGYIMRKANKTLAVSEHLKQEILACNIKPHSIEVSYNPVDTNLFKLRENNTQKKILFAGRLDSFKGAFRCLQAFEPLSKEFPDWTFTIVGDGEDMALITQFLNSKPELKNKIRLTGYLSKNELSHELSNTSFFVFPSLHESFGLVVAEALSCGVPVITGNKTAPKEFVNEQNGLLVSPESIEDIRTKMKKMILEHNLYNSETIRKQIVEKFSMESFGKYLCKVYDTLLI